MGQVICFEDARNRRQLRSSGPAVATLWLAPMMVAATGWALFFSSLAQGCQTMMSTAAGATDDRVD